MIIKYHINTHKDGKCYLWLALPKELIKQCALEHRDKFNIEVTDTTISIIYDIDGAYILAKNAGLLGFHINSIKINKKIFDLLRAKTDKTIPAQIKGNKLIADISKLVDKPKGFNLFHVATKGFSRIEKKQA